MTEFLRKNKLAATGLFIVAALTMAALFAPWLAPYDPADQKLMDRLEGPTWKHPFGNDELGRDILSRILWGAAHEDLGRPLFAERRPAGFGAGQRWNGDCDTQRSIAQFSRLGYSPANTELGCYVE